MKKLFVSLLAAILLIGCNQDDTPVSTTGNVSFVVNGSGPGTGRVAGLTPEKVVVSVEDKNGKVVLDNKIFDLASKEGTYVTEVLPIEAGDYRITKYLVISGSSAAYVTPKSGAQKATLIDKPLPIDFTIVPSRSHSIAPTIIGIGSSDVPQLFGYNDFGYDIPGSGSSEEWLNVRVKLEMIVGGIYYPNVDAHFTVKGFNESNSIVWSQTYNYTGPESNDLKIKNGFHHYTIEAEKWGKTLSQTYSLSSLLDIKIKEGQVPVTQVFQTELQPKKVTSATTSWSKIVNGETVMVPVSKKTYEYKADGRLGLIRHWAWNETLQKFTTDSETAFDYLGKRLDRTVTYQSNYESVLSEDQYTYDDLGYTTHIKHKEGNITTEVEITHLFNDRLVKATYRLSNGNGFEYEFENQYGSMKSDKTTRGSQLCSEATYTSDKNINPMKHLGYTDYLMRNYSISNRITESANYIGCAFPSVIAESYSYVYNEDGYPKRATTHFKGTGSVSEVEYTYAN